MALPRGIRNNNPLNIRKGGYWKGLSEEQNDCAFCQFRSLVYGIRAGLVLISHYIAGRTSVRKPINTPEAIISRWAPPTENATRRYINFVCKDAGLRPQQVLVFSQREVIVALVYAMIFVECGQRVDRQYIEAAYDLV